MHAVYLLSVTLHILAAMTWTGGMIFLVVVVVPLLRRGDRAAAAAFLRESGTRFRAVGWTCFAVLLVTGAVNLSFRGVHAADLVSAAWLGSAAARPIVLKLATFAAILGASAVHDFVLGPRATAAVERDPASAEAERLRRRASLLGRVEALLALVAVGLGVVIVRGWPW